MPNLSRFKLISQCMVPFFKITHSLMFSWH